MASRKLLLRLAGALLSGLLVLLAMEGLLQIEYAVRQWYKPSLSFLDDELGWLPVPGLSTRYAKRGYGEISYSTNADGFRRFGDPRTAKVKVWAIGDSTTQAYQVSDGQAYYDVLAALHPGLEVFGYGVGGYGTVQQAMVLERFWPEIRPDVVIWQLCANDFINNDWELESASHENNNHMARPYLGVDGRIALRHPDRRLGSLAPRSLLGRRLAVLASSLAKQRGGSIETELRSGDPAVRRTVATTRRAIERRMDAAPSVAFLAFFVPSPERHAWEAVARDEVCALPRLECLPEVEEAIARARHAGVTVDGGEDPHWNAAGHEIVGRVLFERLRRDVPL